MSASVQLELLEYPSVPGAKERGGTSEEAARRIEPHVGPMQRKVLAEVRKREGTADEIAARIGEPILTVRPRVTELYRMGLVAKTSERRKNASGMSAWVWEAVVEKGAACRGPDGRG